MKVVVADLMVGNLHSIAKALESLGAKVVVESDVRKLAEAECLVLPGVASFTAIARSLEPVRESLLLRLRSGVPALGICIGLQALFERSEEGPGEGIGYLPGVVSKLKAPRLPHMGWNGVDFKEDRLFEGVSPSSHFYFAHSYAGNPGREDVIATTDYGGEFVSALRKGNTYGVQFHPEKSGPPGLRVLRNFLSFAEENL